MNSLSCIGLKEPLEPEMGGYVYNLVTNGLQQETSDPEAAYRALVAVGNLVSIDCCSCRRFC